MVAAFALFLLGLTVSAPFAWIRPAYALPEPLTRSDVTAIPHRLEADFGGVLRMLGYDVTVDEAQPGDGVEVMLYWEALSPADRDYTVFVHLLGEEELLVAQRDTFPGLGRLSTMRLEPGFCWADRYVLRVPSTAYAPDVAQIEVGVYDAATGTRLSAVASGGERLGDQVRFGRVEIRAGPGAVPNPISVNFGGQMALVGYDLDRRMARPGEEITLTLYWQGLRRMGVDYTVSTQFVDAAQRKAAQQDAWPQGGAAPTSIWQPGQVIVDVRKLAIFPDAPAGTYDVRVVAYVLEEGEITHLPVIPGGGQMLGSHVVLTGVRVVD